MSGPRLLLSAAALRENYACVCRRAQGAAVWCVLKGDAYGMGLTDSARILQQAGATAFAVTEPAEVTALREAGITGDILLLRPTELAEELAEALRGDAALTIGSEEAARAAEALCRGADRLADVHVEFDLGMGRGGFRTAQAAQVAQLLSACPHLRLKGVYGHANRAFGNKKYTRAAYERLTAAVGELRACGLQPGMVHMADSVALFRFPEYRLDGVRVGSALSGALLCGGRTGLQRVARAECPVMAVRTLEKGETAGYGDSYRARRSVRVAVVPMGYADGALLWRARDTRRTRDALHGHAAILRQWLTGRGFFVTVGGRRCRVLGYVGMKHLLCDVSRTECRPGDMAVVPADLLLAGRLLPRVWTEETDKN